MMIVLIVMWFIVMMCMYLSWDIITKVKNKTIKENLLSERQSHYSRNISTSSHYWQIYNTLEINLKKWNNSLEFKYNLKDGNKTDTFSDRFQISNIIKWNNPTTNWSNPETDWINDLTLTYTPYKINCVMQNNDKPEDELNKIIITTKINNRENYCFEIYEQNCKLQEISCTEYLQYFLKE